MVKIGNIELQGELGTILLDEIVEDVPISERHAQELAASIRVVGQISPLIIWKQGRLTIDGFHRVRGMKLADKTEATCLFYDCDEETFWNLRILNAVTHQSVSFARIVTWVRTAFAVTKWAQKMEANDAFRVGQRRAAVHVTLTLEERRELSDWVAEKARLWNLSARRIGQMLRIAHMADPALIGEVRNEAQPGVLTQSMLEYIANKLRGRDLQQGVVHRIKTDKLILRDVHVLVDLVAEAKTPTERNKLLNNTYHGPRRGRPSLSVVQGFAQLRTGIVRDSLDQLVALLPQLEPPQPFDGKLTEVLAILHIYMNEEERTALEILQRENQELKGEVQKLSSENEQQRATIGSQQFYMVELQQQLARRD